MTFGALSVLALGFFLGMRHAVDPDHVIAVSTIVSRNRGTRQAALIGMLWGLGHTLTVFAVGAAIILFNVMIPPRLGLTMELAVGIILILLGIGNVRAFVLARRPADGPARPDPDVFHAHPHVRPVVVGLVHGLAGSSAVALLVLAAIRDPYWATAYLLVFGLGTMAGMVLVTVTMASAMHVAGGQSPRLTGRVGLASGLISVAFGLFMAYQIYTAGLFS